MKWGASVLVLAVATAIGGCGGGSASTGDTTAAPAGVSAKQLSTAYGKLVGICLASEFTGESPAFSERQQMRRYLQQIVETAEGAPGREAEGLTSKEILFDVVPTLEGCDQSLALEAETAATR